VRRAVPADTRPVRGTLRARNPCPFDFRASMILHKPRLWSRPRMLFALLLFCVAASPAVRAEVLDKIVAVVNSEVILQSELDEALTSAKAQIRSRGITPPSDDVLRSQVLDRLVLTKLQIQRAKQSGIRVDDRELNGVIQNVARQNNLTLEQFRQSVLDEGMSFEQVREQIRDEVMIQRLRQREVDSRVLVTDQDIDLFLAQQGAGQNTEFHIAHILVAVPDGASPEQRAEKRKRAEGILAQLKGGADFAQMAVSYSDGQQALQGGDLDWRGAQDLPKAFIDAVTQLQPGQVSGLIETTSGYHILKLLDTRGGAARETVTETRARHILLQPNTIRDEEQTRLQARELYDRLRKGADFAELARRYSDDAASKNSGGDLGFLPPGQLVPDFQSQIDALAPGQISEPFHTQFGWHIAQVMERRVRDTTVESQRARARAAIQQRKAAEEYDVWLRRLRDEAYVEYRPA
jgi:peptidyl-prolyl cis-trans isomerase SurA